MTCAPCKNEPLLTSRVTVQQIKAAATVGADGAKDLTADATWEDVATRWCAFKTRGGSERFASDQIQAGQTHTVTMRYDATTKTFTTKMRMVMGTRNFNILAVMDRDEMHQWIVADVAEAK